MQHFQKSVSSARIKRTFPSADVCFSNWLLDSVSTELIEDVFLAGWYDLFLLSLARDWLHVETRNETLIN